MRQPGDDTPENDKFREVGCDEDEAAFEDNERRVATAAAPEPKLEPDY